MATPPGWAKDTSNENIFSTTIPAKSSVLDLEGREHQETDHLQL